MEDLNIKLEELAKIRDEQVVLEEKRRKIEGEVFPELEAHGVASAETPYGVFSQKIATKIEYDEDTLKEVALVDSSIKALKEQQDAIKAQAEVNGKVVKTTSVSYMYKATKI